MEHRLRREGVGYKGKVKFGTVMRVEIMRSGRLAAIAGAILVTGACAAPVGVAGVGSQPPAPVEDVPIGSSGSGTVTAATGGPGTSSQPFVTTPSDGPSTAPAARKSEPGSDASTKPKSDEPVPVPPPKVSSHTYAFPVKGCRVTYARRLLTLPKTTIWAAKGCLFVAPVDGTVHEVNINNQWAPSTDRGADREGRFVTIIGDDGVRYLGGHLDSVAQGVRPGVKVKAGQPLGRVGNSGNARDTASNLYFAVSWEAPSGYWWVRRGMVNPWDYLDAWFDGNKTYSPRQDMLKLRKRFGGMPACSALCAAKPVPTPTATPTKKKSGGQGPIFVEG